MVACRPSAASTRSSATIFRPTKYVSSWGATNVLNQYYVTYLGGPSVGGLYYLAVTYGL